MDGRNVTSLGALGIGTTSPPASTLKIQSGTMLVNSSLNKAVSSTATLQLLASTDQKYALFAKDGTGPTGAAYLSSDESVGAYANGTTYGVQAIGENAFGGYFQGQIAGLFARGGTGPAAVLNGSVGIYIQNPVARLDIDSQSNTGALRIRGSAETNEITDIYVDQYGDLIFNATYGTGVNRFIDLRTEDNQYGIIIRESDGTATTPYANIYVQDAANPYVHFVVNAATEATTGLVVNDLERVGIGTKTPQSNLDVIGIGRFGTTTGRVDLGSTGNAYIEMREIDGSGTPYIDFSNDGAIDYDGRIVLAGDDEVQVRGAVISAGTGTRNYATGEGEVYVADQLEVDSRLMVYNSAYLGTTSGYKLEVYDTGVTYPAVFWG
ncbi:TPA: hypothetical protein HA265_02910, partial [Candidatus Woesearchaeota archaeon]|nr:hypothetical protein [Candidatus Woesearchaeota archaeon]